MKSQGIGQETWAGQDRHAVILRNDRVEFKISKAGQLDGLTHLASGKNVCFARSTRHPLWQVVLARNGKVCRELESKVKQQERNRHGQEE